jgi:hypothetical protein
VVASTTSSTKKPTPSSTANRRGITMEVRKLLSSLKFSESDPAGL